MKQWTINELCNALNVDPSRQPAKHAAAHELPGRLPAAVQAALDRRTGDRSGDTAAVVNACYESALTLAQTRAVVNSRPDLAERLAERRDDDVLTLWLKAVDDHHRRTFVLDQPASEDETSGSTGTPEVETPRQWKAKDLRPAKPAKWLARGHLPEAAITLLVGEEGIGKSLTWVWLARHITTGQAHNGFGIPEQEPREVTIVVTEDDWQNDVRPRLEVAGVDLDYVNVICTEDDGSGAPVFPRDCHILREADPAPALIVIDAWLDTVPASLSVKDPQQARQALHPWKEIATATGAAVLLVTHTNRVSTGNARDKYGATSELRKKARMTLYAQRDEQSGMLLVGPEKSNGTAQSPATLFKIEPVQHFEPTVFNDGTIPKLVHVGASDQTAREHLAEAHAVTSGASGKTDPVAWLRAFLADGPRIASEVFHAGEKAGISESKLRTAKLKLNVTTDRQGDPKGPWWWVLPGSGGSSHDSPHDHVAQDAIWKSWQVGASSGAEDSQMRSHVGSTRPHDASTSQDFQMTNGETWTSGMSSGSDDHPTADPVENPTAAAQTGGGEPAPANSCTKCGREGEIHAGVCGGCAFS